MKCVIFAGGKGNRIRTYNDDTPKPLITIGDEPIIWHIMRIYYSYGIKEFIICLGYKQERFKQYFLDMFNYKKDFELSFGENEIKDETINKKYRKKRHKRYLVESVIMNEMCLEIRGGLYYE